MQITAAVVRHADGPVELTTLELDGPADDEVVVRIEASGVCRTDALTRRGVLPFPLPGVLGHEGAGVVAAVGDAVTGFSPGDRVVIGRPFCGVCHPCRAGQPRHCLRLTELLTAGGPGLRGADGTTVHGRFYGQSSFATHALTTAAALTPVPDSVPLAVTAPLTCDIATGAAAVLETLRPGPGARIAVFGTNLTALAAVLAARATAATQIVVVDRDPARLARALLLGATHVVDASVTDPIEAVADLCGGPADAAVECTGDATTIRRAVACLDVAGTCVLAGDPPVGAEFTLGHRVMRAGRRLVGAPPGATPGLVAALLELYVQGRFPVDALLEERSFAEVGDAMDDVLADDQRKPVLRLPQGPRG